ncbi:MAG: hypothetical protein D6701_11870 [Gemmatimonadetes bacterium]|nr:MAG: hypothetical protein D6701_11870 [Gemmatimonadota bacterium]
MGRAAYRHLMREAVTTFRLARMDAAEVVARTRVEGLEALERALAAGRGALVVTGHLGNWEIGGAALSARGLPVDVVAHRQKNPLFDAALVRSRARLGLRVIVKNDAFREGLAALREGRVLALVADQNVRRRGVFVDFFGRPASTAKGAGLFALRTGAPIFLGVSLREPGIPARYRVVLESVPVTRGAGLDEDVRRVTAHFTAALERWIRQAPEQYFWHHRRWKTRPADESGDGE